MSVLIGIASGWRLSRFSSMNQVLTATILHVCAEASTRLVLVFNCLNGFGMAMRIDSAVLSSDTVIVYLVYKVPYQRA